MTKTKTEILSPSYLLHHPKEWASKTGWSLKMNTLIISMLITAIIGFCAMGFMFSLGIQWIIDWVKTGVIVIAIFTVIHSFVGHGFDDRGGLLRSFISVVISTLVFTGVLFNIEAIRMYENISDRAWTMAGIAFLSWMIQYFLVLHLRKMDG